MKSANVTPVFKKDARTSKNNYRPVSILPVFSNLFEQSIRKGFSEIFKSIFAIFMCGFGKDYGDHNCPLMMLETYKEATHNKDLA